MKMTIRIIALAMVSLILCLALASCGKTLSGTYEAVATSEGILGAIADAVNTGVKYTFSGSKVTIETTLLGSVKTFEGKYSIDDDKITFTFEDEDAEEYSGTQTFEELENGDIKIGIITYEKED